jgi:hypothetical protein
MISVFFHAFYAAFIPLLALSALLSYWFLKNQPQDDNTSTRAFKAQLKTFTKNEKKKCKQDKSYESDMNLVQKKWMTFGGNFYGIVALYTYILVEVADLAKFFRAFSSISDFIARIDLKMILGVLMEALMNFVTAITWPVYWLKAIDGKNAPYIWFAVAYLGYLAGMKVAMYYRLYKKNQPLDK